MQQVPFGNPVRQKKGQSQGNQIEGDPVEHIEGGCKSKGNIFPRSFQSLQKWDLRLSGIACIATFAHNGKDDKERDDGQSAKQRRDNEIALLLSRAARQSRVHNRRRGNCGSQRSQQIEEHAVTAETGALIVIGGHSGSQRIKWDGNQSLKRIAQHEHQADGGGKQVLIMKWRRPP